MYKKLYRSFVKLWLNHWCHINYFTDLLATFLDVVHVNSTAVYGRVRQLSECIKNIFIFVPKMILRSYGFGTTWGWVINDTIFILGWSNPLRSYIHWFIHSTIPEFVWSQTEITASAGSQYGCLACMPPFSTGGKRLTRDFANCVHILLFFGQGFAGLVFFSYRLLAGPCTLWF